MSESGSTARAEAVLSHVVTAIVDQPEAVKVSTDSGREPTRIDIEVGDSGITDGGENAPEVRVGSEEGRLDQRRVADRIADLAAFLDSLATLHGHRDELGSPFAVTDDGLGQFDRHSNDGGLDLGPAGIRLGGKGSA